MDRQVIAAKLESLRRSLVRITEKCPSTPAELARDLDAQDIIAINLTRAVQLCVDIAAHLIAAREVAPPNTMGQAFDILAELDIIDNALAHRLKKSVGFRNIAIHNYNAIDWQIVHAICSRHLDDFREFARSVADLETP